MVSGASEQCAELHQAQEILHAEAGAASGEADKGIGGRQTRPGERERAQVLVVVEEHDPPLPPVLADVEQFKPPTVPWMERMSYREELRFSNCTRCC
jgi:hypothetical protein